MSVRIWLRLVELIDGLVQDCSNPSAWALELLQFCTKSSNDGMCGLYEDIKTYVPCLCYNMVQ